MKPPWKYLARLMSRQRSFEAQDAPNAPDSARKLVEIEQRPAATVLLPSPEVTSGTEQMEGLAIGNIVAEPAAIEIDAEAPHLPQQFTEAVKTDVAPQPEQGNFDTIEPRPAVETAIPLPKLRQVRSKTARKDRASSTLAPPAATTGAPSPATSSPAGSFFDNASSLDEEIKQLKDLLARKLVLQNAQLREMLERFERS